MDPFGKTSHCRGLHSSGKNSPHQLSMHIGQPVLASLVLEGQLLVVDAQQMENRRIEVMHMDRVLCNVVAEIIGLTITDSAFYASTGHPGRETTWVVITAVIKSIVGLEVLSIGGPAKFAGKYNQCIFKQSTPL